MPSPLKQYLRFQDPQEVTRPGSASGYEAWARKQAEDDAAEEAANKKNPFQQTPLSSLKRGPGGADEAAASNAGQEGEPRGALGQLGTPTVPQGSMAQTYGTPTPQAAPEAPFKMPGLADLKGNQNPNMDQYINEMMSRWRSSMDEKPPELPAAPPQRAPLPQRPERPWTDIIPQLLAGAGNVFSAASHHPQDYLGQVMGMQEGRRNQIYEDALRQHANQQQADEEGFRYQLEKAHIMAQERSRQQAQYSPFLQAAIENKYLGKTPADTAYQQQLDWARTLYKDSQNPQDIKDLTERMVKQFPERERAIREAGQEAGAVNKVQFEQTKGGLKRLAGAVSPTSEIQRQVESHIVPGGEPNVPFSRAPILGAPRGYRALYGLPGVGTVAAGTLDALEAAGMADFSGGPKHGGPPVHLPAMSQEEQIRAAEELQKRMKEKRAAQTQRYNQPNPWMPGAFQNR